METNRKASIPKPTKTILSRSNNMTVEEAEKIQSENKGPDLKPSPLGEGLGGVKGYDFAESVALLNKNGKALFGPKFQIQPADYEIVFKLLVYAIKDQKNAVKLNIDLNKGIMLSGPVGCGKTSLMTLINLFQFHPFRHVMKTCRDVSFEFIREGYDVVHKYSTFSFSKQSQQTWPRIYCFDDLGTENSLKYYGNECNVMAEILLTRYELFGQKKMLTHLTTNLSATEIEGLYGNRVRSRLREMFNLVAFEKSCKDKRS